jgi:hypothetical protein
VDNLTLLQEFRACLLFETGNFSYVYCGTHRKVEEPWQIATYRYWYGITGSVNGSPLISGLGSSLSFGPMYFTSPDFRCRTIAMGIVCSLCATRRGADGSPAEWRVQSIGPRRGAHPAVVLPSREHGLSRDGTRL